MPLTGDYEPSPQGWVREQVETYEGTGGREGNTLLDTGVPVEHHGEYALVASKGGADEHPEWHFKLQADPTAVMIQEGPEPFDVVVREVDGEERAAWWDRAVEAYPPYAEYQEATDRRIPVHVARRA